ncbi:MAG TPA: hypothetical protein VGF98_15770 [Candidatus Tumulicola sp.]
MTQLIFSSNPIVMFGALLLILLLAIEIPYRWGKRNEKLAEIDKGNWNTIQAGIITLAAFMLGLTFAQAQGRFDARRDLVVKEANAIGTTWLRADQLVPPETVRFRKILTAYTRERLQAYSTPGDSNIHRQVISDSDEQQAQMWSIASKALRDKPNDLGHSLLMTTLNDTIDISSEQLNALTHHVPTAVIELTILLAMLGAISIGLQFARSKSRPLLLTALYAAAFAIVLNLIVDYDRPQVGFIHVSLDPISIQLSSMER